MREHKRGVGGEVWGHSSLTNACRRPPTASARPSLRLLAAPEARRWAPKTREEQLRENSPGQEALQPLGGHLATRRSTTRRRTALRQRV